MTAPIKTHRLLGFRLRTGGPGADEFKLGAKTSFKVPIPFDEEELPS